MFYSLALGGIGQLKKETDTQIFFVNLSGMGIRFISYLQSNGEKAKKLSKFKNITWKLSR